MNSLPAVLLFLASAVPAAEEAVPASPAEPAAIQHTRTASADVSRAAEPAAGPADPPGDRRAGPGKFRFRPFVGVSAVGLAGLDNYSDSYVRSWVGNWQAQGMAVTAQSESGITWALVQGLEAVFQLDPQVCLASRLTRLSTESGSRRTVLEGNGDVFEDSWSSRATMTALQAGAGFDMPVSPRMSLNITLFVGAGFANTLIMHRVRLAPGQIDEFAAEAFGVAFLPEFSAGLDLFLTESLAAGLGLGYRFGTAGVLENRHATSIRDGTSVDVAGSALRNRSSKIVQADFGGPVLRFLFTVSL